MNAARWIMVGACVLNISPLAQAHEEAPAATPAPPVTEGAAAPARSPELELVGHLTLQKPSADLWAHKNVVYVGSWMGSKVGLTLVDIADPAHPEVIGSLPAKPETTYEDVAVISVATPRFQGDLLAVGLQGKSQGAEFWDVTDPRQPKLLSLFRTSGGTGVHELCLLQREGQVLALLTTQGGGMRIVDVTDPTKPQRLVTWNVQSALKSEPVLGAEFLASFDHSVSTNADGTIASVSCVDAGAVMLDISNPAKPRFLGRTVYPLTEEGNTHSAVEADGGNLLITTDEDSDPTPAANCIRVTAPVSLAGLHNGVELGFTTPLATTGPIRGEVVYVGSGLPGRDLLADPQGKIALIDPVIDPTDADDYAPTRARLRAQVRRAKEAGAIAVLFTSPWARESGNGVPIPGMWLLTQDGTAMKKTLKAGEKVEVELTAGPVGWGFLRLWDIRDRANPVQIGAYATAGTLQFPPRRGSFSVHNPVVLGNRLYLSWYADGVRVLDIADPTHPREMAHFVPPFVPGTSLQSKVPPHLANFFGQCAAVWGVVEHQGLILLSDIQSGLWILRDLPH